MDNDNETANVEFLWVAALKSKKKLQFVSSLRIGQVYRLCMRNSVHQHVNLLMFPSIEPMVSMQLSRPAAVALFNGQFSKRDSEVYSRFATSWMSAYRRTIAKDYSGTIEIIFPMETFLLVAKKGRYGKVLAGMKLGWVDLNGASPSRELSLELVTGIGITSNE